MNKEFKADHFESMEELLDTIKIWLINEEEYGTLYDDFNRYFDTGAMEEMYYYINELQERINKAIEYMKYNATSNYFDKEKNMFRREEDLLEILKGDSNE